MANKKKKKNNAEDIKKIAIVVSMGIFMVALIGVLIFLLLPNTEKPSDPHNPGSVIAGSTMETTNVNCDAILEKADVKADMYDYDAAVEYVKANVPNWENNPKAKEFIKNCGADKERLVKWADNTQITHVFFHTLIADCNAAFSSSSASNYNEVMTTIDEFNKILQQMYARGYVLVKLSDIAAINPETGNMEYKPIYLPQGKKPFVLSEDDVSYYEYMMADGGFASRLIIDENGRIMNEKDNADGSKTVGAFDVVPLLDKFVEEHPDFSYHGAKGVVALTGYNGILGYRTSYIGYGTEADLKTVWDKLFNGGDYDSANAIALAKETHYYDNPNLAADREAAKKVADAMKAEGWEFASHTWGHMNMGEYVDISTGKLKTDRLKRDCAWWATEVEPLVGKTDTIIFAYGADINSWKPYTDDNEAFMYLKSRGFNYYCNVDSTKYYVQMSKTAGGSGFLRQGRRNLDGQLMYKSMLHPQDHILDDIINVNTVFDKQRPTPVSGVE